MKAIANIKGATSSLQGGFYKALTDQITFNFLVSTPHHYLLQFTANWADTLKNRTGPLNLRQVKVQADFECDESLFVYPTTIHAQAIFLNMIALHAQVMSNNAK